MKILFNNTPFDLDPNTAIEMERPNPFFNDYGEQSAPITLPPSSTNIKLTGTPTDIAIAQKANIRRDVTISDGLFHSPARMVLLAASPTEGISTSIYLNEGALYERIKDVTLKEVFNSHVIYFQSINEAMDYLWNVYSSYDEKFSCFRIFSKEVPLNLSSPGNKDWEFRNAGVRTINDIQVTFPPGFFITPFIRVIHLLTRIFLHFGYTFIPGFLETSPWNNLVLLNHNADTLLNLKICYSQIVPDCNVSTLLNTFSNKFCMEFIPDESTRTVTAVSLNEIIEKTPNFDITKKLTAPYSITFPESRKQLRLKSTIENSLDFTSACIAPYESPRYLQEYKPVENSNESLLEVKSRFPNAILEPMSGNIITFRLAGHILYSVSVGSLRQNYYAGGSNEVLDKESPDIIPAMRPGYGYGCIPYVGTLRYLNTTLQTSDSSTVEENSTDLKPILCFSYSKNGKHLGTISNIDYEEQKLWNETLFPNGKTGLFETFWKKYDSMLRNSMHEVKTKILLREHEIINLKSNEKVLLHGQELLPNSIRYPLGKRVPMENTFFTIKNYEPISSAPEPKYPSIASFKWIVNIEKTSAKKFFLYKTDPEPIFLDSPTEHQYNSGGRFHSRNYPVFMSDSFVLNDDGTLSNATEATITVFLTVERI